MALELIAAVVAALALAGLAYALRRLTGGRLPKWIVTLAGAVGLIGFTIWSEYDWFNRVSAELPPGVQVVWHKEAPTPLRPWTFLFPITTSFVALDLGKMAQHPANPHLKLAPLYNFARWQPVRTTAILVDCARARQVLITEGVEITEEGRLTGADWVMPPVDDGVQTAACAVG